ncbi:aminopeptidase P family protein [Aneurinibacillus sp. Ricciae_BoGa-3]|uniref:M24 family metallopeptidase n=1 Tax=Aneurinibacillus sp. Ricciae_BoGa-3 TaxID=3022697 RepID=UPI0023411FED|nr:aminopeptidase P family protein [Aneurinibacillus sp. Ricciae_BoGa-3]WCK53498.1 aminopeptidase P family protein [Aneurinibacillus sp. Ricciae_BoGa-3]
MIGRMDNERLYTILDDMNGSGLDGVLLTSPISVAYFTGFVCDPHERFLGLWVGQDGETALFLPSLEKDNAAAALAGSDLSIVPISDTDDPYQVLRTTRIKQAKKIAVEKDHLRLSQAEKLQAALGEVHLFDIGATIARLRNRKADWEVDRMKEAVRIIEEVMEEGIKRVKLGMTEVELVAELEYLMKEKGADEPSFGTTVLAGKNSALPHGTPGTTKIEKGGFLLIDMGVFKDGYCSDITRTFAVGEPTDEMKKIYEAVQHAVEAATNAVKVGRPLAEVDRAARGVIEKAGYGEYFTHRVGHGLGLEIHEYPSVHGENQDVIEAGMTFTIEPGIYVPGVGGVRIEDDIYVTEAGAQTLMTFPKSLTIL